MALLSSSGIQTEVARSKYSSPAGFWTKQESVLGLVLADGCWSCVLMTGLECCCWAIVGLKVLAGEVGSRHCGLESNLQLGRPLYQEVSWNPSCLFSGEAVDWCIKVVFSSFFGVICSS